MRQVDFRAEVAEALCKMGISPEKRIRRSKGRMTSKRRHYARCLQRKNKKIRSGIRYSIEEEKRNSCPCCLKRCPHK